MKIEMTLLAKNVKVKKICKTEKECEIFERDMPAKYGIAFSKTAYLVGKKYL